MTEAQAFTAYVALGDSMSIDLYPALDAGETDVAVALERVADAGVVAPLGAASLLHHNDDARWPDEQGADLVSYFPDISFQNLAADGATIGDVFGEQMPQVEESADRTLITITAGGNDLLSAFANRPRRSLLESIARDVAEAYEFLLDSVRRARPNALNRSLLPAVIVISVRSLLASSCVICSPNTSPIVAPSVARFWCSMPG